MTQDWLVKDPLLGIKIVKKGKRNCLGSERRTTSPPEGSAGDVLKKAKIKHHASKWMWHELLSNSSWHFADPLFCPDSNHMSYITLLKILPKCHVTIMKQNLPGLNNGRSSEKEKTPVIHKILKKHIWNAPATLIFTRCVLHYFDNAILYWFMKVVI